MNSYLTPGELAILLELVDDKATRRWRVKRSVVSIVGSIGGGGWISGADVAVFSPFDERSCRLFLGRLERARVLLRDGAAGRRPGWCRVNPDWRAWRPSIDNKEGSGVVWRFEKAEIASRLARYYEIEAMPVELRFVARSMDARQDPVVARSIRARLAAVNDANVQVDEPEPDPPSRVSMGARQRRHLRAVKERATSARPSPKKSSMGSDGQNSSSFKKAQRDKQHDTQLRAFLFKRCLPAPNGDRYVVYELLDRLDTLMMRWGCDTVTAWGDALGKGYRVPDFIGMLELRAVSPDEAPSAVEEPQSAAERAEQLGKAIANRRAILEVYVSTEADEELIERTRAELAACETELAAVELSQEGLA